ncbi:vanin-like protein 1 [Euwallacea similis]|uniref:vanin-like protein 1 n=1 Tax=Euwallacea similis TaxID=1736056 RepID=UPI00344EEAC5
MWVKGIVLLLLGCTQLSRGDYIAAVVEYNSATSKNGANWTIEENVHNYIYQIQSAHNMGAQIIVFPEYGLSGVVEDPENYSIAIPEVETALYASNDFSPLLSLSNAAIENKIYVVANFLERALDTSNSTVFYSTTIVFSITGSLIAKYRKINLYNETNLTPGSDPVTFTTEFGTFGLITSMDILYLHPSKSMFSNVNVTDVIYVAAWTSYIPFYMSLEVQVGYALANKVNLLASNINNPVNGRGGSSIVSSDGTVLRKVLTDKSATTFMYANVQTQSANKNFALRGFDIFDDETREVLSNYKNLNDFNYDAYTFRSLNLSSENITDEICSGDFCCSFNILAYANETNASEVYKLVAYEGKTPLYNQQVDIKFCAVVACLYENDISSCGVRPPSSYTTVFRHITVWGVWKSGPEDFYRPVSLKGNLDSVYNVTYLESRRNEDLAISYNITAPHSNVVLFGLFVRSGVEALSISLSFVAFFVILQGVF